MGKYNLYVLPEPKNSMVNLKLIFFQNTRFVQNIYEMLYPLVVSLSGPKTSTATGNSLVKIKSFL